MNKTNKNIARRVTWLDNDATERTYIIDSKYNLLGKIWIVRNEYQWVKCPGCKKKQYCKVTKILRIYDFYKHIHEEHNNYNRSLKWLKDLRITFVPGGKLGKGSCGKDGSIYPLKEIEKSKKWVLTIPTLNNFIIGKEI